MLYFFGARKVFVVENRSFSYKTDCDTVWDQKKSYWALLESPMGGFHIAGHSTLSLSRVYRHFLSRKNLMVIESFSSCFRSKDTINRKIRTAFSIDLRCLNFGSKS